MKLFIRYIYLFLFFLLPLTALADFEQPKPMSARIADQLYNPAGNTVAGNPNGSITLVEFFDYNCPNCRDFQPKLERLIAKNPELRVVYKEYLLFGEPSVPATQAVLAANNQGKYLDLHKALLQATKPLEQDEVFTIAKNVNLDPMKLNADMRSSGVAQQIAANNTLAKNLGIQGTPTFIITNRAIGKNIQPGDVKQYMYEGNEGADIALQKMIDALKTAS